MLSVINKCTAFSLLDNDVLRLDSSVKCERCTKCRIRSLRKYAGICFRLGLIRRKDLEHRKALKGIILICRCGVNKDRDSARGSYSCRSKRRLKRNLESKIERIGIATERLVDIVKGKRRVGTGINDDSVIAVTLLHHDCKTCRILTVYLEVGCTDALVLIVLIKLLTVEVCANLGTEEAICAKLLKSHSGICPLATGNVRDTAIVNKCLTHRRHFIHIHRQVHICTADNKNLFISHFLFFLFSRMLEKVSFVLVLPKS